eukprot:superscaffoldBa00000324_g3810
MGGVAWEGNQKAGQMTCVAPEGYQEDNQMCGASLEDDQMCGGALEDDLEASNKGGITLETCNIGGTAREVDQMPGQMDGVSLEVDQTASVQDWRPVA